MNIFKGIIPALVTPFNADSVINESVVRRLINHVIDSGCHGVFVGGSQGEFWALNNDERAYLWDLSVNEVNGKLPVYANISSFYTQDAINQVQLAEKIGVDAVSVMTPFYIQPNEAELFTHFQTIASSTKLPVFLYSNPSRTGVNLSVNLLVKLSEIENIVGIKDSSGNLEILYKYISSTASDFSVFIGRDSMILSGLSLGAKGAIAATANICPALVVSIYENFLIGNFKEAEKSQKLLTPLRSAFDLGTFPSVVKEGLTLLGYDVGPTRAPVGRMGQDQKTQLEGILRALNLSI